MGGMGMSASKTSHGGRMGSLHRVPIIGGIVLVVFLGCSGSSLEPTDDNLRFSLDASAVTLEVLRPEFWGASVGAIYRNPTADTVFVDICTNEPKWRYLVRKDGQWTTDTDAQGACILVTARALRIDPGAELQFEIRLSHNPDTRLMRDGERTRTFRLRLEAYSEPRDPNFRDNFPPGSELPFDERVSRELTLRLGSESGG